jgi:hypothetical protein
LTLVLGAVLWLLAPVPAAVAGPSDNSNSRPWSLQLGLGPSVNLEGGGVVGKFAPDFQYHFKGGDAGPALGAQAHMHFRPRIFGMNIGPVFLWDFRVVTSRGFKMYVAPEVSLGYGFTAYTRPDIVANFFFSTFGAQLKFVFSDVAGFYFRPLDFSLWAGQGGVTGYYSFIGGATFMF